MGRVEIIISGFGGQGIVRAGYILGRAAALGENKESSFVPSYGPEARGGSCASRIVIDENKIDFPFVTAVDILVSMSEEAYDKYIEYLKPEGILLYDEDLVKIDNRANKASKIFKIPATRIAEQLGNRIVANVVMLGFLCATTKVVSYEALRDSVMRGVPQKFLDLNLKAFDAGYNYMKAQLRSKI
ncbi:MAG: pyruvate ferredoxin oxidoreductase [Candidatus Latescibacterota bacterium]|nr:MAG: pyruvate ferredoxin oxidoreductase [Candidatus Latescibacterota bacterium]